MGSISRAISVFLSSPNLLKSLMSPFISFLPSRFRCLHQTRLLKQSVLLESSWESPPRCEASRESPHFCGRLHSLFAAVYPEVSFEHLRNSSWHRVEATALQRLAVGFLAEVQGDRRSYGVASGDAEDLHGMVKVSSALQLFLCP